MSVDELAGLVYFVRMIKKLLVLLVLIGLVVAVVMIPKDESRDVFADLPEGVELKIVCTSTMVTDMVRTIGGERVFAHGIMGPGVDPHSYQVVSSDSAALRKADLVFYSGLHLEGKMQDTLEKRAANKKDAWAVTSGIKEHQLLQPQEGFSGYHDPHVWGDPRVWAECIPVVVKVLSEADPEGAEGYRQRGDAYRLDLLRLHEWIEKRVAELPEAQRVVVTSHDAFYYFGKAYGFEVRGLQGVSTNSESGLKDRAELVSFIQERGLKMIFPETSVNAKGIKAVADEAGVRVSEHELFSDAMGPPHDYVELHGEKYDKGRYIGMIKHNVNTLVDGLK